MNVKIAHLLALALLGTSLLLPAQKEEKPVQPPVDDPKPAVRLQVKDAVQLQVRIRVGEGIQLKQVPNRAVVPTFVSTTVLYQPKK